MKKITAFILSLVVAITCFTPSIFAEDNEIPTEEHDNYSIEDQLDVTYSYEEDGSINEYLIFEDVDGNIIEMDRNISQTGVIIGVIKENGQVIQEINTVGDYTLFLSESMKSYLPAPLCNLSDNVYVHKFTYSSTEIVYDYIIGDIALHGTAGVLTGIGLVASLPAVAAASAAAWIVQTVRMFFPKRLMVIINTYDVHLKSDNTYLGTCWHVNSMPIDEFNNPTTTGNTMKYIQSW